MRSDGFPGKAIEIEGIDLEIIEIVDTINSFGGIYTVSSCSGHGVTPMEITFWAENLAVLPALLYWFDACHSGERWVVDVHTDCGMGGPWFTASSTPRVGEEARNSAMHIVKVIQAQSATVGGK